MKRPIAFAMIISLILLAGCESEGYSSISETPAQHILDRATPQSTVTMDSVLATNEIFWAAGTMTVEAAVSARGVTCPDPYRLAQPERLTANSNSDWTVFTCLLTRVNTSSWTTTYTFDTFIERADGSQKWSISSANAAWMGTTSSPLSVYKWAQDGDRVYLVESWGTAGTGGTYLPGFFVDYRQLLRVDLASGDLEILLPNPKDYYSFALSPDEKYLAYVSPTNKKRIIVRDLGSGEEKWIELDGDFVLTGIFVWKPDSTQLIFASAKDGWDTGRAGISVFLLTLSDMNLRTILNDDTRLLIPFPRQLIDVSYLQDIDNLDFWFNEDALFVRSIDQSTNIFLQEMILDIRTTKIIETAEEMPGQVDAPTSTP